MINNVLDMVQAAAEPAPGTGLEVYQELCRLLDRCQAEKFMIGSKAINDGTVYAALDVTGARKTTLIARIYTLTGFSLKLRLRCEHHGNELYLTNDGAIPGHVQYRVGNLNRFRTVDELGTAVSRAALHYYPKLLPAPQVEAAAEHQASSEVQPSDTFRERATLLFPSAKSTTVSYGTHKLIIHSENLNSDGHLMVFADDCSTYALEFTLFHYTGVGTGTVHVILRHYISIGRYQAIHLTEVPDQWFQGCVTKSALLKRALSIQFHGNKVIDSLLRPVAAELAAKHVAESATEPMSHAEKPDVAYFGSWIRLFPMSAINVRARNTVLNVRYVNSTYPYLEVQYQRSPWALQFYSDRTPSVSADMFRIRVVLNRRRLGHTLDSDTLALVSDKIIDGCQTKQQLLKIALGIQSNGKSVLQHLIQAATATAKTEAATEQAPDVFAALTQRLQQSDIVVRHGKRTITLAKHSATQFQVRIGKPSLVARRFGVWEFSREGKTVVLFYKEDTPQARDSIHDIQVDTDRVRTPDALAQLVVHAILANFGYLKART
jgi:hypothetical protein